MTIDVGQDRQHQRFQPGPMLHLPDNVAVTVWTGHRFRHGRPDRKR